ncbi:sugar ABC transporter permease [Paenibacillus piri]|uniref:Sugar ABC transporter permease n=2 Tax=Paenibacillus piri TaxID=2547395 RepID=A0A4V2ZRV3_9BACL|nr:sugar ABC transporter permease [Paenibacillus piri]
MVAKELGQQAAIRPSAYKKAKKMWSDRYLYLLLLPVIAYYLIFHYAPMYGVIISFQDYNMFKGVFGSTFIGLENFRDIFSNSDFYVVLRNTLMLNCLTLLFGFPGPIILALLLNEVTSVRFKRSIQTLVYLPHFISWVVVASLIIPMLSPRDGIVNAVITALGGKSIYFMGEASWWIVVYVLAGIWKSIGWGAIIYLAALTAIDTTLYEAAVIDGAGRWKQTFYITLPGIRPTIIVLLILNIGHMMSVGFDQPFLLGNGAVIQVSDVLSTYVYRLGLLSADVAHSTAVGLFQAVVNFIMLIGANFLSKKITGEGIY